MRADRAVRSRPRRDGYPNPVRNALLPPVGSYRRTFTAAQLRAAGADDADVRSNLGVTTLTFGGPRYRLVVAIEWRSPTDRPRCRGLVDLVQRRAKLRWNPATPCTEYIAFSWKRDGRDLEIVALDPRTERRVDEGVPRHLEARRLHPDRSRVAGLRPPPRPARLRRCCPPRKLTSRADPVSAAVPPAAARQRPASRHPAATRPPAARRGLRPGRRARRALIRPSSRLHGRRPRR